MANENNNNNKKSEVQKKMTVLLQNRLGISPSSIGFTITNTEIEGVVEDILKRKMLEKGVNMDDCDIMIRAVWNREYDQIIKQKKYSEGVSPFYVYVGIRLRDEERRKNFNSSFSPIKGAGQLNDLMREVQRITLNKNQKIQTTIVGYEKLQESLSVFVDDGKLNWEVANKKAGVIKLRLSTNKIISHMLCLDTEDAKQYRFDIDIIKAKEFGGEERNFSIQLRKSFKMQNFKKNKIGFIKYLE